MSSARQLTPDDAVDDADQDGNRDVEQDRSRRRRALTRGPGGSRLQGLLGSERRVWWAAFALFTLAIGLWALSSPLLSPPDEPAHVTKAAAVVRGQLLGHDELDARGDTVTHVKVPAALYPDPHAPCFGHHYQVSAACWKHPTLSQKTVDAGTLAGHYQPLYYAIVGVGSLVLPNYHGIYLMRLISAVLNAAFLASALLSVRRFRRSLAPLGLLVAVTPQVLFLSAAVNPSGFEITTAICAWASLLALLHDPDGADRRLIVRLGISASALALSRSLSPLWLLVIVVVGVMAYGFRPLFRALTRRAVQVCAAVIFVCTLVATAWIVHYGALTLRPNGHRPPLTMHAALLKSFGATPYRMSQMVGFFGWLDTEAPAWTFAVWIAVVGLLVLLCLATTRFRVGAALIVLGLATFIAPIVIEASQEQQLGLVWQGRYTLPIAVGVPLVAGCCLDFERFRIPSALGRRLLWAGGTLLMTGQLFAFWWNMRRYTVGLYNHGYGLFSVMWHTPLFPPIVILLGFGVVLALLLVPVAAVIRPPARSTRPPTRPGAVEVPAAA